MDKAVSTEQLLEGVGAVRDMRKGCITNFFFDKDKHYLWVAFGDCYHLKAGNTYFIVKDNPDFLNVFYCSTDPESLKRDLCELEKETEGKTLVLDIVGKGEEASEIWSVLEDRGYRDVCRLTRMSRKTIETPNDPEFLKVEIASSPDEIEISELLDKYFDKELEQLPYLDELITLINNYQVLVYRDGKRIAGFVIYEKNKTTLYLRYWFVRPEYRDKKIGGLLLRNFFYHGNDIKRQILWVVKSNENSLKRYYHYGFGEDGLEDRIFIKGNFTPNPLTTNNL